MAVTASSQQPAHRHETSDANAAEQAQNCFYQAVNVRILLSSKLTVVRTAVHTQLFGSDASVVTHLQT